MIRVRDAAQLAFTKLRTRKIRLGITIIISSLIFSVLAAASFVSNGTFHSIESFSEEGFGGRYILSAGVDSSGTFNLFNEPSIVDRGEALEKSQVVQKRAEAKRLGIEYNASNQPSAVQQYDGPNGKERVLNPSSRLALQAVGEYLAAHPSPGQSELAAKAKKYGALDYYKSIGLPFGDPQSTPNLAVLKDGKEQFDNRKSEGSNPFQKGTDSFTSSWQLMSGELLKPFVLPGQSVAADQTGVVPVVAPYTAAEQLLSLPPLPSRAKPETKLARLKEVRAKAADLRFSVCYRNEASSNQISQTISTQEEIDRNQNNKDYQKPNLIYALPDVPCGPIRIAVDKRSAEEKKNYEKQELFRRTFGEPAPTSQLLHFKIVGLSPDPPDIAASTVVSILNSFLSSNLGAAGWFTPLEVRSSQPLVAEFFPDKPVNPAQQVMHYVELPSADSARKFTEQENCQPDFSGMPTSGPRGPQSDPYAQCKAAGKVFSLASFGSSSLALDEARQNFGKFFRIVALVVTAAASIIMIGTVGRVIADSRRETAVFRAIGAKRLDIAQVYFTYTVFLAGLVGVTALCIGFILASVADAKWSSGLTVEALIAYNAQDLTRQFSLFGLNAQQLLCLAGLIILAGLASAVVPLLANLRRNPIKDMRDES